MQIHFGLISFVLASVASAVPHEIEGRDDVSVCEAVLLALKASAFCSSFVPIKDVTSTSFSTSVTTTTNIVCPTKAKREPVPATSATNSITVSAANKTPTTTAAKCNVGNAQLKGFACDVITKACVELVKPKTTTVTAQGPTSVTTSIVTSCSAAPAPTCSNGPSKGKACQPATYNAGTIPGTDAECKARCDSIFNFGQGCTSSYFDDLGNCQLVVVCCLPVF